ncbi:MAG: penicillin-binding protein 1C [Chitinophagales bacterium]|nr:penicillin-binding protein 1C [Hyphomicrobiales bacterium]
MEQEARARLIRRPAIIKLVASALCVLTLIAGALGFAALRTGPPPLDTVSSNSRVVLDRNGQLLRVYTTPEGRWRLPAAVPDVDQRYLAMLLAFEDKRFYEHGGVDMHAIGRAGWQMFRERRAVSGASTLTMQTARLLGGASTHSGAAKISQMIRARQIEARLSKREILELYLRLAPFGGNIEGVRAASLAYFGKEPRRLAIHEAALLVALPQSPEARRPDRSQAAAKRARDLVLTRAAQTGVISIAEAEWSKSQAVPTVRREFPALAAHLSDRLIAERAGENVIHTTLDKALQEAAEALAARQAAALGPKLSAAIIAADHATGEVLAHAGSAGYFDADRQGSIDMTAAVRSPGSALKPFIYGLAFENGHAHPQTLINDAPSYFHGYRPENFDKTYRGEVTAAVALQFSLNIPAVKLLAAVTPAQLSARFRRAGVKASIPRNLSVALGGVGLTLEELTGLYATLARGGEPVELRYARALAPGSDTAVATSQSLLSSLAAWYVTDILRQSPPPHNAPFGGIAFKTGTSYGYRDAWAAGYDGRYIVGVWLGRADASPTPGLTGLTAAAPVVFDMFSKLSPNRAPFKPAPFSAIVAGTAGLAPPLARFREPGVEAVDANTAQVALRIAFPPNNAEIEIPHDIGGAMLAVILKAEGGALPLTWLIDGAPAQSDVHRRQLAWTPGGKGFANLTVIDATGQSQRVIVRIR